MALDAVRLKEGRTYRADGYGRRTYRRKGVAPDRRWRSKEIEIRSGEGVAASRCCGHRAMAMTIRACGIRGRD